MTNSILLSIIIPYFNSDDWIGKMLETLLDQDLSIDEYEIIIIDDGSTQSATTLMDYVSNNPIIKYFRKENGGVSSARNLGIDLAKGEWIYFCDSDDFIQPQVLGYLLKIAKDNDLEMLRCDYRIVGPDGITVRSANHVQQSVVFSGIDYLSLFVSNPFNIGFAVWLYLIKRSVLIENNIRFNDLAYIEDSMFQLDLLLVIKRLAHTNVILYNYVQHETSITHSQKKDKYELYASWLWQYILRLHDIIRENSSGLNTNAISVLNSWKEWGKYELFKNCFRYCPVSTTKSYLNKIQELNGEYPLEITGTKKHRFISRLIGHKTSWIALCQAFHLLPKRIRKEFYLK